MKILCLGFGSRGDVQPLLALCDGLAQAGYAVTIGASADFQSWIEARGFAFAHLGINMQEMLTSALGKEWVENSANPFREMYNFKKLLEAHSQSMGQALLDRSGEADVLLSNLPTFGLAQAVAEKYGHRHMRVMLTPLTPSVQAESTMAPMMPSRASQLNRVAGYIGIYSMYWVARDFINAFRRQLGLPRWGYSDFLRAWNQMPVLYGVSPTMMPRDAAWRPDTVVTGYWFDAPDTAWQPPDDLARFLERHPRPVYLGFGSMGAKDPGQTLGILVDALQQAGQPGIIYSGWAGLRAGDLPEDILLIDGAPHEWLFPRMAALVHHGGAGTAAAGVRAGVPATVVAHMGDQSYWGRRLYELGVGHKPIHRTRLNAARLAQAISAMTAQPQMRTRAQELAAAMQNENGVDNAVHAVQQILGS